MMKKMIESESDTFRFSPLIPVVDLFAGPGGLSEGFSSVTNSLDRKAFEIRVSIEKDPVAYRTLSLRALFRSFPDGKASDSYYDYLRGMITRTELFSDPAISYEVQKSLEESVCANLGETPTEKIDAIISRAIGDTDPWVLIGGPPCQAYSIAGRSRRKGVDPDFEKDEKHFLYREYLRIIQKFHPAVFVMENVKGLLTSTHGGEPMFARILSDLSSPKDDLEYEIRSFVVSPRNGQLKPTDFIIRSERYGIPQMRHRVILLGVRKDYAHLPHSTLNECQEKVSLKNALFGLPSVRSRLSREPDSFSNWLDALSDAPNSLKEWESDSRWLIEESMFRAIERAGQNPGTGGSFIPASITMDGVFAKWILDPRIGGVCQHETRKHMRSDLHRYMFAACFLEVFNCVPRIRNFPKSLLPNHKNINLNYVPFVDRFRVQPWDAPSSTIVSHIAKDGHFFIHPDPSQCRTLTVREAARLQTFPDNYYFEGNRTQQYTQVGNAVPPALARQLGQIVADFLIGTQTADNLQPKSIPLSVI